MKHRSTVISSGGAGAGFAPSAAQQAELMKARPVAAFGSDIGRARAVARRLRTGTVGINGGVWFGPDVPFGGYKGAVPDQCPLVCHGGRLSQGQADRRNLVADRPSRRAGAL